MSAPPSTDAYDAQMLDFSLDPDVPMNIPGSTDFFTEALMDHDGHLVATYAEHASVEVDMEEYVGDNSEYEMADETAEYQRLHGDELLDIEVYDASHAPSPLITLQPLQSSVDVPIEPEHPAPTSPSFSEHAAIPKVQGEPESKSEVHPVPLDNLPADAPNMEPSTSGEVVSSEAIASDLAHLTEVPNGSVHPLSESREQLGDTARSDAQLLEALAPAHADDEAESHVPPVAEEHLANSESPTAESALLASAENAYDSSHAVQDEKAAEQAPVTEGETVDPLHISDGVYIDPPPAVLFSIANLSEPGFALFNQPDVEGESAEESHGNQKVYPLLLENRPTLYYEPLSSVFEALRQDEGLLSRVPHSFEGELILDAYDLQLAIPEDNVHSRDISLHDLNVLHDGSDFVGPLRLLLRAIFPRFIIRYYALQEQIRRLNMAAESEQEQHEEHHEQYGTGEEQFQPQQEEAANHSSHPTAASDGSEAPSATEAEAFVKEPVRPSELTGETLEENYEPEGTFVVQEPTSEHHEVIEDAAHALEDDGEYEDTNTGDEDESAKSDRLGSDQIHGTAEDTDAAVTVTAQESEFGGEQTEYPDYVQPEEYEGRYDEDLPERAGMASPIQYGESSHYEEGEQDAPSGVDETQAVLPGLEEDEDKSPATPIPTRAVLDRESSELADPTNESVSPKQEKSVPSSDERATSEPTNEYTHTKQASGNQQTSTAQAKILSEIDESDSNFVSILEREADTEFDGTFTPEQNGQEGSIEATVHPDEAWDEWDDEDAEGEDEEGWIDPDATSNESSATLSSKLSSKRSYDEVDLSQDAYVEDARHSPGSKRQRV